MSLDLWPEGRPEWASGYIAGRPLDDEHWLIVIPLTFGRARLNVAEPGYAGNASVEHWCMDSPADAIAAWLAWPEPPTGWNRHQRRDGVHEYPGYRPGDAVVYQPQGGRPEDGEVVRVTDDYVFVLYRGDTTPKATHPADLTRALPR